MGRSRSSQIVRPSQEQICLGFWKRPAERAMMPQANLWKDVWSAWAFPRPPQGSMCPTGTSMSPAGGGTAHLFPEFPVILDKGWFPRPRSSSPSSTTRLRPITSHTFEGKQQPQLSCPLRRAHILPILPSAVYPLSGKWLGHQPQPGCCPDLPCAGMRPPWGKESYTVTTSIFCLPRI